MKTITKTAGIAAAAAALALPAGAVADKGPHPTHPAKKPATCTKTTGFTLAGTGLDASGLTVTDGKANGTLVLDVTSANKHARRYLGITKLPAADQQLKLTDDAVKLRFDGVNGLSDAKPTDRVKVIGRVTKPRKGCETAPATLDVRKITVNRPEPKPAKPAEPAAQPTAKAASNAPSQGRSTAPGQLCKAQSHKKTNHGRGQSAFAACVSGAKRAQQEAAISTAHTAPAKLCADKSHKKAATDAKSPFAACVTGAAKAQQEQRS